MNILDIIPQDLWIETLSFLNYRDLLRSSLASKLFNDLCIKNNIKDKIKYAGFPRKTGHCNFIDLSQYNDFLINKSVYIGVDYRFCDIKYNCKITTNILINSGYELIRGDLITFMNNYTIFDGCELISFKYKNNIKCIPKEFTIINNNIPFDYWFRNKFYKGLSRCKYIWFDITEIRQQCLNNIRYNENNVPVTTFTYNNNKYDLYAGEYKPDRTLDDLKYKFENNLLLLDFNDIDDFENILMISKL